MIRLLRLLGALATGLGIFLALPGLLFLFVGTWCSCLLVDREHAAHDAALYPSDIAFPSEPSQ